MSLVMILFFVTLLALNRMSGRIFRGDGSYSSSTYAWLVPFWIVQFVVLSFNLFNYTRPISYDVFAYIMLAHLAFFSGSLLVMVVWRPREPELQLAQADTQNTSTWFSVFAPIAVVSTMIAIYAFLSISNVSLIDRLTSTDSFHAARAEVLVSSSSSSPLGILGSIASFLSPFSFCVIAAYGYYRGAKIEAVSGSLWCRFWGSLAVVLLMLSGPVIFGSRAFVFMALFPFASAYLVGRREFQKKSGTDGIGISKGRLLGRFAMIVLLSVLVTMASAYFQMARDMTGGSPDFLLGVAHHAQFSGYVLEFFGNSIFAKFYLLTMGYICSSANILSYYFDVSGEIPGPFNGAYNFPSVYGLIAKTSLVSPPMTFQNIRVILFSPLQEYGYLGNVWATILRDLIADFGYNGCLVFMLFFGAVTQVITDKVRQNATAINVSMLSIIRLVLIWSAFHSLFFFDGIDTVLLVLGAIVLLSSPWEKRLVGAHISEATTKNHTDAETRNPQPLDVNGRQAGVV
jgi:hypothetical protein